MVAGGHLLSGTVDPTPMPYSSLLVATSGCKQVQVATKIKLERNLRVFHEIQSPQFDFGYLECILVWLKWRKSQISLLICVRMGFLAPFIFAWLKELSWCITGDGSLLFFSFHFADIDRSLILQVPTASCSNTLTIGSPNSCPCSIPLYNQIWTYFGDRFPTAQFEIPLSASSLDFLFGAISSHLQFIGAWRIAQYAKENFPGFWQLWIFSAEDPDKDWLSIPPSLDSNSTIVAESVMVPKNSILVVATITYFFWFITKPKF